MELVLFFRRVGRCRRRVAGRSAGSTRCNRCFRLRHGRYRWRSRKVKVIHRCWDVEMLRYVFAMLSYITCLSRAKTINVWIPAKAGWDMLRCWSVEPNPPVSCVSEVRLSHRPVIIGPCLSLPNTAVYCRAWTQRCAPRCSQAATRTVLIWSRAELHGAGLFTSAIELWLIAIFIQSILYRLK